MNKKGILLETGNNELEIIEFKINGKSYGINVMKVREVVHAQPITTLPHSHPFISGIFNVRNEMLRLVDLGKALGEKPTNHLEKNKFLICELNKTKIAFDVNEVVRIHRISWENIETDENFYEGSDSVVIGVVQIEGRMVLLLDFEKILVNINPDTGISIERVRKLGKRERTSKKIIVAEDSKFLQKLIKETLDEAGFDNLLFFQNGLEAFAYLQKSYETNQENVFDDIHLMITDIEMPKMDGLTLTKKIKEHAFLRKLPIIVFSSLITESLKQRAISVGADDQVSKPEIAELVTKIDRLIL